MNDDLVSAILAALKGGPRTAPATTPASAILAALGMTPANQPAQPPPSSATPYSTLSQLTRSPFADTLHALTGRPGAYTTASHGLLAGEYFGTAPNDTVSVTGLDPAKGVLPRYVQPSTRANDEWTLSHELGHKYSDAESQRSRQDRGYDSRFLNSARATTDSAPNQYANESRGEYRAQAFANAVNFLRQTAALPPDATGQQRAAALRAQYDAEIPGTSGVVDDLLSKPIYRLHPLNVAGMAVRPDASAVRKP